MYKEELKLRYSSYYLPFSGRSQRQGVADRTTETGAVPALSAEHHDQDGAGPPQTHPPAPGQPGGELRAGDAGLQGIYHIRPSRASLC